MNLVMSDQKKFCDNLQVILTVWECQNAWDSSVNLNKLVYTDWGIVQACPAPAKHYRQLGMNSFKLFLLTYIIYPSSWTNGIVESVNADVAGHYIYQNIKQDLLVFGKERKYSVSGIFASACISKF